MNVIEQDNKIINLFLENRALLEKDSAPIVNAKRQMAMDAFARLGFPSNKVEAYKYTNLKPHFVEGLKHSFSEPSLTSHAEAGFKCDVESLESHTIFTINGKFASSNLAGGIAENVLVGGFAKMANDHPQLFEKYYSLIAPIEDDGFVAANTMLASDGVFIYLPKGAVVEKPIQVINILTGSEDLMVNQRNLIILEENAQARVIFCDHALSPNKFVVNSVTEGHIENTANLDFYSLQNQHNRTYQVGGYYFNQKKQSVLSANYFTLHCGVTRNNIFVKLGGERAECHVSGLYLLDKNQHVDNFSFIDHAVPDCESFELFKGVVDDAATGAFTGRIMVRPDAQRTNAYQSNNNLLMTQNAKINTRPQLEIYADDVKCSHGATIGQLDEKALFYLRARGIGMDEANILLMYAFAYEVIEKIRVPALKEQIRELVEKRFRGDFDKCDSCVVCSQHTGGALSCI